VFAHNRKNMLWQFLKILRDVCGGVLLRGKGKSQPRSLNKRESGWSPSCKPVHSLGPGKGSKKDANGSNGNGSFQGK
jgi:hypothetical protein